MSTQISPPIPIPPNSPQLPSKLIPLSNPLGLQSDFSEHKDDTDQEPKRSGDDQNMIRISHLSITRDKSKQ